MKECCWNAFLTALLIVVMILWRPSTNPEPTDYSQVNQEEEEEMEQKVNKNLGLFPWCMWLSAVVAGTQCK